MIEWRNIDLEYIEWSEGERVDKIEWRVTRVELYIVKGELIEYSGKKGGVQLIETVHIQLVECSKRRLEGRRVDKVILNSTLHVITFFLNLL